MIVVAAALLAVVLVLAGLAWVRSADLLIRRQSRRVVLIELRTGETFKGVLISTDARSVLMRDVQAIASEQSAPAGIDGELLIPRSDIKYLQRP